MIPGNHLVFEIFCVFLGRSVSRGVRTSLIFVGLIVENGAEVESSGRR